MSTPSNGREPTSATFQCNSRAPLACASIFKRERSRVKSAASLTASAAALLGFATALHAEPGWFPAITTDSIVVGTDVGGAPLFVCRTPVANSQQLGKTQAAWSWCTYGYRGTEAYGGTYELLTTPWGSGDGIAFGMEPGPAGASRKLSVCRGFIAGGLHLGKKIAGTSQCWIPYGGLEMAVPNHDTLIQAGFLIEAVAGFATNAIAGGFEQNGALLYPCIGLFSGGEHPGKTQRGWNSCSISWGGVEHFVANYKTLVPVFRNVNDRSLPQYFPGRHTDGTSLGVCTALYRGSTQVGKYLATRNICSIAFAGEEIGLRAASGFKTLRGLTLKTGRVR